MKYYLSSYKIGDYGSKLIELAGSRPLAYIPNAVDHIPLGEIAANRERNMKDLRNLGVAFELFDLKDFFFKTRGTFKRIKTLLWSLDNGWKYFCTASSNAS